VSYRIISLFLISACSWSQTLSTPSSPIPTPSSRILKADNADDMFGADPFSASGPFVAVTRNAPPSLVPADELARVISKKGIKLLTKVETYMEANDSAKAIDTLQEVLKDPSAAPYAHGLLGTEYLKLNRIADAVNELEQAVQLLPHNAPARSNLGYALFLAGEQERGEQEVRKALVLDSANPKTRHVLSVIERGRGQ
jgi:tetratricopeptide (TPR) repeat protein